MERLHPMMKYGNFIEYIIMMNIHEYTKSTVNDKSRFCVNIKAINNANAI